MAITTKVEPQKSEVHDATADASGSPTADGDAATTMAYRDQPVQQQHVGPKPRVPTPPTNGTRIVEDQTDVGGPLVIQTGDPDLVHPQPPIDPFPTDGTPEIDPPVEDK